MKKKTLLILLVFMYFGSLSLFAQPQPPTDLNGQVIFSGTTLAKVYLTWQYTAPPTVLVKYNVYRKDSDTGTFRKIYSNLTQKSFYDHNVYLNRTYSYKVTAYTTQGESQPSNMITVTITPPPPPIKATVTGIVTNDSTGNPVAHAYVSVFVSNSQYVPAYTDSLGRYKIKVNAGQYYIYSSAPGYVSEYYNNVTNFNQATKITLASNDSININIGLSPLPPPPPPPVKATVTGVITNETTGNPIFHAMVKFFGSNSNSCGVVYTDSLGKYKIKINAGQYYLYTSANGFVSEYYNNVPNIQQATKITLAGNDSININVALTATVPPVLYTLSGSVKDSLGNKIKATVRLYKVRLNTHYYFFKELRTDSLGSFSTQVKQGDTLVAYAYPYFIWDWYPEYYNNKRNINTADRIPVYGNITGINFILEHKPIYPNGITGTVKDTLNAAVQALVHAFPKYNNIHPIVNTNYRRYITHTDSLGVYQLANLFPGKYILFACPEPGYKPTYFRYDGMPTLNWRHADSVVVDSAGIKTGINFIVRHIPDTGFAFIAGIVKDNLGNPINGAFVYAVDHTGEVYGLAISNERGLYNLSGLVPGEYIVISDKEGYSISNSQSAVLNYETKPSVSLNFLLTPDGVTEVKDNEIVVSNFDLFQNYPNPFNPSTVISYQLPAASKVTLKVYNVLGNEVATLVNSNQNAGKYNVTFNGSGLSSGIYFYKIEAGTFTATKKLILMK
jgi:protocatechuate 3,4-dioxygenase beta subunit